VLRIVAEAYLYIARGVPLLVLLFAMYYALPYAGIIGRADVRRRGW